ncbi:Calcium-dependent protein kinase 3 [Colletotrichum shisoi]|uniref:EKC/KEOPS complex subunit BUD32 n=1 Tax=Colletotrichum shisoi TaxID=2078593 RepID=A0A5Q4BSU1_9PEZI|nr:Calcium-dependent protein kinase 3 [Colletotrichum shisoi]
MEKPLFLGSSSNIYLLEPGKVIKVPREVSSSNPGQESFHQLRANGFKVERGIYEVLGTHDLIIPYYGCRELRGRQGLVLAQADENLQHCLDVGTPTIDQRKRWCRQAAKVIAYIHSRGVMHSDLRPENFLVQGQDIRLSDFNGSVCERLNLDGNQLPDNGFWNLKYEITPATDIFALGSVLYAILTGWWPFCGPDGLDRKDVGAYEQVNTRFGKGQFPDVSDLPGGHVILGCWTNKYESAADVMRELETAM